MFPATIGSGADVVAKVVARAVVGVAVAAGAAVAAPAATAAEQPAAQTWSVQPADADGADDRARWDFDLEPGESVEDLALVNNFGDQPVTFRVYSHDAINAPDGAFTLQPADAAPVDVGAWVGLDEQVTIDPGASAVVPFTLTVPDDAAPGDHAGGIVASVTTESADADGQQVLVDNRVGARIYLRVAGAIDPVLTVGDLQVDWERSWVPFSSGDVTVTYDVRNIGNIRLSGAQTLTGHGLLGLGEHTATVEELPEILPGQSVTVSAHIEDVAPLFRVTEEVAVNPRPPESTTADVIPAVQARSAVTVWAMPWAELILLAVLVLGVVWSWWQRRRRNRRATSVMDEAMAKAREELRRELHSEPTTPAD